MWRRLSVLELLGDANEFVVMNGGVQVSPWRPAGSDQNVAITLRATGEGPYATTQRASRALDLEPLFAQRIAVDLHRGRRVGRHHDVRGIVTVIDVTALHVAPEPNVGVGTLRRASFRMLNTSSPVSCLRRHAQAPVLVVRVRIGAPHRSRGDGSTAPPSIDTPRSGNLPA